MVLNGHALGDGTGYLVSTTDAGTPCHQMLSNYQMNHLGGGGYLRLLQFLPDGHTVRVQSYSPLYDRYLWGRSGLQLQPGQPGRQCDIQRRGAGPPPRPPRPPRIVPRLRPDRDQAGRTVTT